MAREDEKTRIKSASAKSRLALKIWGQNVISVLVKFAEIKDVVNRLIRVVIM